MRMPPCPDRLCTANDTRVMFAVLAGAHSTRDVAKKAGLRHSTAYASLRWLQALGLVDWEPDLHSTIVSKYGIVSPQ